MVSGLGAGAGEIWVFFLGLCLHWGDFGQKRFPVCKMEIVRLLGCKPAKIETLFFRKQLLLRCFSFGLPLLVKVACIFTCHTAL